LKNDTLNKAKRQEIEINESDTFDAVVERIQPTDRSGNLKKDVILADATNTIFYSRLKDLPFSEVRKIYINKESLIDDKKQDKDEESKKGSKRDDLIKHLFKIQDNINLYQTGQYNQFIRKTEYRIASIADKRRLKENIQELTRETKGKTIEEIMDKADEFGFCKKDDRLFRFIAKKPYLFSRVKEVPFSEFQNLYSYLEGYTPFSTQHKTKGTQFNNVLVILDNGGWPSYNFKYLFEGNGTASVTERTKKIFYVCCTRAKENLAVFFHSPSPQAIEQGKQWFGEENVISIR
jgi:DNA helicase-2/ATP-dependent DNA helicase PcrA